MPSGKGGAGELLGGTVGSVDHSRAVEAEERLGVAGHLPDPICPLGWRLLIPPSSLRMVAEGGSPSSATASMASSRRGGNSTRTEPSAGGAGCLLLHLALSSDGGSPPVDEFGAGGEAAP